ncbi:hypothetical protein ACHWQZ_G015609 [Mnemiopsis leidyi]
MVRAGEAHIKEEFLIEKPILPAESLPDPRNAQNSGPSTKRKKGQNKKRRAYQQPASQMLCQFLIKDSECLLKERCKKSHDKQEFLSRKGPDLGDECVNFKLYGVCNYGIACRFGSNHLDKDLSNIMDVELNEKMKIYEVKRTLQKEIQSKLRSKHVWFKRSYQYFEENGIDFSNELQNHLSKFLTKRQKTVESDRILKTENNSIVNGNGTDNASLNRKESNSTPEKEDVHKLTAKGVYDEIKDEYYCLKTKSKRTLDLRGKLFLSPLTTVGNLPFRRICKEYGADITCGEMALCEELVQGQMSEWALLKRHHTEDVFGVQICGNNPVMTAKTCELINSECDVDFIDLNVGCPIDLVFNRGAGSALMDRASKLEQMLTAMVQVSDIPVSVKMRMGTCESKLTGIGLCERLKKTGISHITVHGRTRQQRYTRLADWEYIRKCKEAADPVTLFGNGDILSYEDYNMSQTFTDSVMIGRGALIKPWIFSEIKEQKHMDVSSTERVEMLKKFTRYGLEHWGTDTSGVEKTRRFMLEWMSFLYRYIPVGVLEVLPQKINERPPYYHGRDETETLMCSGNCEDWVKLSELLLGKVPDDYNFIPKHAANSYSK